MDIGSMAKSSINIGKVYATLLPALLITTISASFNCHREGVGCSSEVSECIMNGTCKCQPDSGFSGFDCNLSTASVSNDCTVTCVNGGTCLTGNTCYCSSDFYGQNCEIKRAAVNCSANSMTVNINPHGVFIGQIFIYGKRNDDNCTLKKVVPDTPINGAHPNWEGFILTLPYNGTCGDAQTINNATMNLYEFKIVTEYNSKMVTSIDELTTIKCILLVGGTISIQNEIEQVTIGKDVYQQSGSIEEVLSPVSLKFMSESNTPLNRVKLGSIISLEFKLSPTSSPKSIKLDSCIANDPSSDANITIVDKGCKTKVANQISSEVADGVPKQSTDKTTVILKIRVFKFITSDKVAFSCEVIVCEDGDASCETQCPATTNVDAPVTTSGTAAATTPTTAPVSTPISRKRRKRATSPKREKLSGVLVIVDDVAQSEETDSCTLFTCPSDSQAAKSSAEGISLDGCFQVKEIMSVIITLALVLVLVILATMCFIGSYIRNKVSKVEAISEKEIGRAFTIPRASIQT